MYGKGRERDDDEDGDLASTGGEVNKRVGESLGMSDGWAEDWSARIELV